MSVCGSYGRTSRTVRPVAGALSRRRSGEALPPDTERNVPVIESLDWITVTPGTVDRLRERMKDPRVRESYCCLCVRAREKTLESPLAQLFFIIAPEQAGPDLSRLPVPCQVALCRFLVDEYESSRPLLSLLARGDPVAADARLRALADSLFDSLGDANDILYMPVAERLLEALIYALAARVQREEASAGGTLIRKALAYMQTHVMRNVGLAEVCETLGVGQEHFIRSFKKEMNIPPMKYFSNMRLRKAAGLLLQGKPVHEVAYAMNFYNESHFSKMFKQYLGATPRRYKFASLESLRQRQLRSDRQLALAVSLLSDFVDAIPDLFFVKDVQFVTVICNQAYSRFVGMSKESVCGKSDFELFPHETATFFRMTDKRAFAAGKSTTFRKRITYPDGHQALMETTKTPCFDDAGRLLGLVCVGRSLDDVAKRLVNEPDVPESD